MTMLYLELASLFNAPEYLFYGAWWTKYARGVLTFGKASNSFHCYFVTFNCFSAFILLRC